MMHAPLGFGGWGATAGGVTGRDAGPFAMRKAEELAELVLGESDPSVRSEQDRAR